MGHSHRTLAAGAAFLFIVAPAGQAQELNDAGWSDPFFANYLSRPLPGPRGTSGEAASALPGEEISFSLPVFGLPGAGELAPGLEGAQPLPLRSVVASWPGCASATPEIDTVPETPAEAAGLVPGTWYVRTFDFGCIEIVVEGDRNPPDPAVAGDQAGEIRESGAIVIDYLDENSGADIDAQGNTRSTDRDAANALTDKGMPTIAYTRGNLTYSFTVVCSQAESRAFCNDEQGLRDMVNQFVVVGGQPQ